VKELQALGLNVELLKLGANGAGEGEKASKSEEKEAARK
jgi:hypothetical protein